MAGTNSSFDPEALLAETAWLHDLARSLVGDTDRADDLVQQTWLRAIEQPPQETRTPRAWLATVLRSVLFRSFRDERTRRRREQRAARQEKVTATPERALERAEMQKLLVDLVIKLEEPYRSAVLLRFFEDMTPEEIARADGVHVTTVRRRLRAGLDCLRARLDARQAGDRSAWHTILLPLLGSDRTGSGTAIAFSGAGGQALTSVLANVGGSLAMKKIVVAGALFIVLCGIGIVAVDLTRGTGGKDSIGVTAPSAPAETDASEVAGGAMRPNTVEDAVLAGGAYDAGSGVGVEGVALVLRRVGAADGVRLETKTDPGGAFRFGDVAPGRYVLERLGAPAAYRRPPDSGKAAVEIRLAAGEVREGVKLTLPREVPLRGKVLEHRAPETTPASGARVVLVGGPEFAEIEEVVAGEDGAFDFHGLGPLENVHLAAEKNGFRTRTRTRSLEEDGWTDVLLAIDTCDEPASVSGRVVDLDGRPLAKMRVLAENGPRNSTNVLLDGFAMTDADGRFKLIHLVPGTFNFNLTPHDLPERGYEWGRLELEAGQQVTDLELVYDRVYSISGGVYNPHGEPVAGAQIRGGGTATTDADGQYVITRLGPDVYNLGASAKNHTDGRISGVAAGSKNVDFVLTPSGYQISGRVLDRVTHKPLTEFELSWGHWPASWGSPHLYSGNIYRYQSFSSSDGRFKVEDARGMNWTSKLLLIARARGFASALELIDLEESGSVEERVIYVRPDGDLSGVVRDAEGSPVSGAEIYYQHVSRFDVERTIARTADDGSFTVASFPQERQQVAVYHGDFASYFVEVPPYEQRTRPLDIVMTKGAVVRGRVIPMPEASTVRVSVSQDRWRGQSTEVNEDGTFVIEKVPPQTGTAQLSVSYDPFTVVNYSNRYALLDRAVTVVAGETTEVHFRLHQATSMLQGKVHTGELLAEAVSIEAVIRTESGVEKHYVHADAEGRYTLDRLPAGDADLTATVQRQSGEEKASPALSVTIGPGETLTRDFDLSP